MKVKIESSYKNLYTIAEYNQAKRVIADLKEDALTVAQYARMACIEMARTNGYSLFEVITADAQTALNSRTYDRYFDGSGHIDVIISGLAKFNAPGRQIYAEFEAYLSEIWNIDGRTEVLENSIFTEYERRY